MEIQEEITEITRTLSTEDFVDSKNSDVWIVDEMNYDNEHHLMHRVVTCVYDHCAYWAWCPVDHDGDDGHLDWIFIKRTDTAVEGED